MYKKIGIILFGFVVLFSACNGGKKKDQQKNETKQSEKKQEKKVDVPDFNPDSAYYYVKKQVDFGPRVPGTEAHEECAGWLESKLNDFADSVTVQNFTAKIHTGENKSGKNIIGVFQPEKRRRILLSAHWDSRPYADQESDQSLHDKPIDGANDGASGVGVLLEIARHLHKQQPDIGIDIIFFDLEDYGEPQGQQSRQEDSWALGSQYWSRNPHKFNYNANYGILLDMVGVEDAQFPKEGTSEYYASDILDKVWKTGQNIGYGKYFVDREVNGILDDHLYINKIIGIPTINIIALDGSGGSDFFEHWHTLDDTMENVDSETLGVVGSTVLHVIYKE